MRVKRYLVDSMPDALEKIRFDLGKDAVILNTKPVKTGGFLGMFRKQQIEVIAAVDAKQGKAAEEPLRPAEGSRTTVASYAAKQAYNRGVPAADRTKRGTASQSSPSSVPSAVREEEALSQSQLSQSSASFERESKPVEHVAASAPQGMEEHRKDGGQQKRAAGSAHVGSEENLAGELRDIREMFSKLLLKEDSGGTLPASFVAIRDRLLSQEVDPSIVSTLMQKLLKRWEHPAAAGPTEVREAARSLLMEMLKDKTPLISTVPRSIKYAYFFGPTGVGKTTTIAKLAAECILKEKRKVGFITSDTYRIAAVEQLKTYANILNAPLEVVFSAKEIEQAMERLHDCELILIDTAGRNYRNDEYVMAMKELLRTGEASENYLVLSLTSRYADMQAIVDRFSDVAYAKVIFTKSDETESYGTMLNVVHNYGLSLSFITTGQNVPDDLSVATPERVADLILGVDDHA